MDKDKPNILAEAADQVVSTPIQFEIAIRPQNRLQAWMQKRGYRPKTKQFSIEPIVFGNLVRISRLLIKIDANVLKAEFSLDMLQRIVIDHAETMIQIIAIAVQNTREEPSRALTGLLFDNLSTAEALTLIRSVLKKMDLNSFINTIISMKGFNVLESVEENSAESEVSPLMQGS